MRNAGKSRRSFIELEPPLGGGQGESTGLPQG